MYIEQIVTSDLAAQQVSTDLMYGSIASTITRESLYRITPSRFSAAMFKAEDLLSEDFVNTVERNRDALDAMINESQDDMFNYTALKALQRSYLLTNGASVLERPQHMFLRAALNIHGSDIEAVKECYDKLSMLQFMFTSPTLYNGGTRAAQLSSCFLLPAEEALDDFIGNTLPKIIKITRSSGGMGLEDLREVGNYRVGAFPGCQLSRLPSRDEKDNYN
ncbi:hypothetical protein H1R20_g7473, partial [Candolleomyces eurysporus]